MNTLLPYQNEGVEFVLSRFAAGQKGVLIADEMGLGKTIQAIAVINRLKPENVLIVCPTSLKLNWLNEIDRWLGEGRPAITITTYGVLRRMKFSRQPIELLIVDESQYVKNPDSLRTKEVAKVCARAKRIIFLSGTPAENRISELWTTVSMLDPQRWDPKIAPLRPLPSNVVITSSRPERASKRSPNMLRFLFQYCGPTKRWIGENKFRWDFNGASNLDELQQILRRTIMVRRLKRDVLHQLPPKRRQIIVLPSTYNDSDLMSDIKSDWSAEDYERIVHELQTVKVKFTEWSKRRHEQGLDKVPLVLEHLSDTLDNVDKLVLFAHHRDVILALAEGLRKMGIGVAQLTGETPTAARQDAVDVFQQDPNCRVFVGSIGAAGVGITLTAASTVIFAELDPVPGRMNQGEDRVHRITQLNHVLVQHLVLDGTLDARLTKLLVSKQEVLTRALDLASPVP